MFLARASFLWSLRYEITKSHFGRKLATLVVGDLTIATRGRASRARPDSIAGATTQITGAVANWRRLVDILPRAWLIVQGTATIAWLCAIAWSGYNSVRWFFS
jgi:hypothetical protein